MSAPTTIEIKLSPKAAALMARLSDPRVVTEAIRTGMDEANLLIVSTIQREFLSFPKGSPPTLDGLRTQSGDYRRSLRPSKAVISGDTVTSSIGTNVTKKGFSYPRLHEFGGTVSKVSVAGSVRLRTDRQGNLLRQGKNGKLAVFARKTHKQAATVAFAGGKKYTVVYPARSPITRGIQASMERTGKIVSRHIIAALSGNGGVA